MFQHCRFLHTDKERILFSIPPTYSFLLFHDVGVGGLSCLSHDIIITPQKGCILYSDEILYYLLSLLIVIYNYVFIDGNTDM